ncbi:MAG: hypothetical protein CMM58_02730 [Rhodospirillaceae bacterium]|nr:hypothetical protein [Rhodospirillaceae bacterium]
MRNLFTLFCLGLLSFFICGTDAEALDENILGAGNISCRVVLKNPEDKGLRKFYENWAQGWISATNHFSDTIRNGMASSGSKAFRKNHPLPSIVVPRRDVIWYKILSYCSEEPKASLADAVKELIKSQWEKAKN